MKKRLLGLCGSLERGKVSVATRDENCVFVIAVYPKHPQNPSNPFTRDSPTVHARQRSECQTKQIRACVKSCAALICSPRRRPFYRIGRMKTANTANMSDRFAVDARTGASAGVFAMTATVHRY